MKKSLLILTLFLLQLQFLDAQRERSSKLTLDRIYSGEFRPDYQSPISWIDGGNAYIIIEANSEGNLELIKYESASQKRSVFLSDNQLTPTGQNGSLVIEDFSMSTDESKVLIFTNSKRVWRSNTKGDYWVYDLDTKKLSQLGKDFPTSSLMFAKFSDDNKSVAYVMEFNLYAEDFGTGVVKQLTQDGSRDIINGTFDWVYEEEFGCRDGFRWSPDSKKIAFWQLDASSIGTFNMLNTTDSIYSQIVPVQYPKVGRDPSSAKIGIVDQQTGTSEWIELKGSTIQNYIPGMQWVSDDLLMIQQLNRKQNHLKVWSYQVSNKAIRLVYEEKTTAWIDIQYPDASSSGWLNNDFILVDGGKSFLRMTEKDWRTVNKVEIASGKVTQLTPPTYDVASIAGLSSKALYYIASPATSTQRYLFTVDLNGKQNAKRVTPDTFSGINTYNVSPDGKYALHATTNSLSPKQVSLVSLPDHKIINQLVTNEGYISKLSNLDLPTVAFMEVPLEKGLTTDVRIIKPTQYDASKKYPVIFHVYGEPWGQMAKDSWIGLWNIMLAQQGYIIVDIDARGTPCLKGSKWRKSIYRKIGRLNIADMAKAAAETLKDPSFDNDRVAVWGWSGGGSSTLNLMFQHADIFKTGISVAPVANQLTYDNIYQERYMGLPQENKADFVNGSPVTHAKKLEGNLLVVHGTADDNVHYQNMEMLVNELILHNKQFDMMSYPNRSHAIYEGRNTRKHLYTLMTNYLLEKVPVN